MTLLPGTVGVAGYVGSLVLITSGYALVQAAESTALMASAERERRGVTSSLLALGRNVGFIAGASAMGALFSLGSGGAAHASESGLKLAFAASAVLAVLALSASVSTARKTQGI